MIFGTSTVRLRKSNTIRKGGDVLVSTKVSRKKSQPRCCFVCRSIEGEHYCYLPLEVKPAAQMLFGPISKYIIFAIAYSLNFRQLCENSERESYWHLTGFCLEIPINL